MGDNSKVRILVHYRNTMQYIIVNDCAQKVLSFFSKDIWHFQFCARIKLRIKIHFHINTNSWVIIALWILRNVHNEKILSSRLQKLSFRNIIICYFSYTILTQNLIFILTFPFLCHNWDTKHFRKKCVYFIQFFARLNQ